MNKNDKFHSAEFDVNEQTISDEELDAVAGGRGADEENFFGSINVWAATAEVPSATDISKAQQ